jgi:phosphoribosylamine--glycine ligase
MQEGHDVSWIAKHQRDKDSLRGLLPPPLETIGNPSDYDLVVYDFCADGKGADEIRSLTPVIGSSEFSDQLEHDRTFGIKFMEECGIPVPPYETFTDVGDAIAWLNETKKRCVFKPSGDVQDKATTYVSKSSEDMIKYLEVLQKRAKISEFLLQEFIEGTEVSTDGWFNGTTFCAVAHTLEEKKFLSGGVGPNTGCSGNLVWMPSGVNPLFERGLRRAEACLQRAGFVGPIDLNTIVTEGEVYGLEWTPRFGYEGTCNVMALMPVNFGEFMHQIATSSTIAPIIPKAAFAATIRVTVPPYPTQIKNASKFAGVPIEGINLDKLDRFFLSDVRVKEGTEDELETGGVDGLIGAPIGLGDTIHGAFGECQAIIDELKIPDMMYRNDIEKCVENRYELLRKQGWLRRLG